MSSPTLRRSTREVYLLSAAVWVIGSCLAVGYWLDARADDHIQAKRLVDTSANNAARRLEEFVRSRRFVLESIAHAYANDRPVEEETFRSTAMSVHDRFNGLLAVNWAGPDSRILWANPIEPNRAAQGRLITEHEGAAETYTAARQSGEVRATGPLELFQGGAGIAVYVPVQSEGVHLGTVNGVFRLTTLIETALREGILEDYAVSVSDGDAIFWRDERFAELAEDRITRSEDLEAFDRTWSISIVPKDPLWNTLDRSDPFLLVASLLGSLLLGLLVFLFLNNVRLRISRLEARRDREFRALEAQKFEALGRLARGVTHDFNNLLTGVQTSAQLLELDEDLSAEGHVNIVALKTASERARELTKQLLTFGDPRAARGEPGQVVVPDFTKSWRGFVEKLVPSKVKLEWEDAPHVTAGIGDSDLSRILTNLVINGVDAMPEGGTLTVSWRDEGEVVVLLVEDTGTGIETSVLDRIFEPYFTTKSEDEGTGLGLPTIYGLAQDVGGNILVRSTVGEGTLFSVSLPIVERDPERARG